MNKDTIIGFVLIAVVLIGFSWYNQPSAEEIEAARKQDSIETVMKEKAVKEQQVAAQAKQAAVDSMALNDTTALFHQAMSGTSQKVVLKNDKLELTLDTKGGVVRKAVIKNFKSIDGKQDVTLFDEQDQNMNFMLAGKQDNIVSDDLYFTPTEQTDSTVTMTALAAGGGSISLSYLLGQDYLLHMTLQTKGLSKFFSPSYKEMEIEWNDHCRQQEKGFSFESRYTSLYYKETKGGTDKLSESSDKTETVEERLDWIAFRNQFFSVALISKDDFAANATLTSTQDEKGSGYLKHFNAKMKTSFDPTGVKPSEFEMYIGPNNFRLIKAVEEQSQFGKELDLEQLVDLGWWLLRWINRWFTLYVFDWLTGFGLNMGIVLILITLLLKAITFPMVKKSYMSSAKMRVLKPKFEEATKQYDKPEDQMKKQQEMMSLYSKYGVSPLSGCLPMIIQMPIWLAMFFFVPNAIQLRGESFLWMSDLSTYDPIVEWGTNIWGIGDHLSLTCILFCAAQIIYTWFSMQQQKDQMVGAQAEQMKMMQWMMYIMPLMFFFIFNDYSSGLNFYYFVSLFMSAAIMWTLRKTTDDAKLLAILEANYQANKNNPKKQSGLAARLEALQKQAEEMQKGKRR
ncbi:YidC/Oxa1 family membrane protein insertase [Prevotella sp. tc2-28]|jgi:YidC/Oxa1 family membrane protein insertase|uniref:membrane protein insertase YidC n=1 Tax=Prevotella sp. tc2-28 TaxID=1761888 RepID=UPI0008945031|nr:membrane protein insertase YidC [Prevotella sp. tc2-28]SEA82542.1 YidC/Oxa1 family membrane protein insertase [Prevotella sp. tc2-28]